MMKEISDCTERVLQVELRISSAEDDVVDLQAKVHTLESQNKTLEDKILDFFKDLTNICWIHMEQ